MSRRKLPLAYSRGGTKSSWDVKPRSWILDSGGQAQRADSQSTNTALGTVPHMHIVQCQNQKEIMPSVNWHPTDCLDEICGESHCSVVHLRAGILEQSLQRRIYCRYCTVQYIRIAIFVHPAPYLVLRSLGANKTFFPCFREIIDGGGTHALADGFSVPSYHLSMYICAKHAYLTIKTRGLRCRACVAGSHLPLDRIGILCTPTKLHCKLPR